MPSIDEYDIIHNNEINYFKNTAYFNTSKQNQFIIKIQKRILIY